MFRPSSASETLHDVTQSSLGAQLDLARRGMRADAVALWRRDDPTSCDAFAVEPAAMAGFVGRWPAPERFAANHDILETRTEAMARMMPAALWMALGGTGRAVLATGMADMGVVAVWRGSVPDRERVLPIAHALTLGLSAQNDGADRDLRRLEIQLDGIMDLSPQAILVIDETGRAHRMNRRAADLLGVDGTDLDAGRGAAALADLRGRAMNTAALVREPEDGRPQLWLFEGETRALKVSVRGLGPGQGRLWLLDDVGAEMRLVDELRGARAALSQARSERAAFIGAAGRELSDPLRHMSTLTRKFRDEAHGPLPPAYRTVADQIDATLAEVDVLIDTLSGAARAGSSSLALHPELLRLKADVFEHVFSILRAVADARRVEFFEDIEPTVTLVADLTRLRQVLLGVLHAAIRATRPGGMVTVSAGIRQGRVRIAVVDAGPGLSREDLDAVAGLGEGRGERRPGRLKGAGFALCRSIVEQMKGTMTLRTVPGQGTEVEIDLPIVAVRPTEKGRRDEGGFAVIAAGGRQN